MLLRVSFVCAVVILEPSTRPLPLQYNIVMLQQADIGPTNCSLAFEQAAHWPSRK
jgi:hypothetical protein